MDSQDFLPAYASAIYITKRHTFTLTLNKNDSVLFDSRSFAIITAHNPRSQPLSAQENQSRHEQLQTVLKDKHFEIEPSQGQSPDGSWQEEGFLILDIALNEALAIGQQFEQHAILYGQGKQVALAWCEDRKLEWFYPEVLGDR